MLCCNSTFAELIEIEKCFKSDNWWNYSKQEFTEAIHVEWTEENYLRGNSWIKISKDKFLKNYKKLDLDHEYWLKKTKQYPRLSYIVLKTVDHSQKEVEKLKSFGGQIIKMYDRKIYSISTDSGVLTKMEVMSEDWYEHLLTTGTEELTNNSIDIRTGERMTCDESCKKYLEPYLKKLKIRGKIESIKLSITSYAGGLLVAENEMWTFVIDFNTSIITEKLHKAKEFTYKCPTDFAEADAGDPPTQSSGTAFFISKKGHMITNNHVVKGCKVSKIIYRNEEYDTKLISTDKTLDLALLKTKVKPKSYIPFSNDEPKKRQKIIIAGYPLGEGLSDDLKINDGRISSIKGFKNNSNEITVDIAINPGNSGGPIINEKGQLVAVAVSGLSKDITEGINFGIKASAVKNFLKSNKIKPFIENINFSMDDDSLVNLLEESTVYTFCDIE